MVKCNSNNFFLINEVTFDAHKYDNTHLSPLSSLKSSPAFLLLLLSCGATIVDEGEQPPLLLLPIAVEKRGEKEEKRHAQE